MATCSWSARIAHFTNLENGTVTSKGFSTASFLTTRTNTRLLYERKIQRLVVVNVVNPETEPKSKSAVTITNGTGETDNVEKDANLLDANSSSIPDTKTGVGDGGGEGGGSGKSPGGDGGGNDGGDDYEEKEFGPLLKFDEVIRETEARGASLPADMLEAAKTVGLRKLLLLRYLDLQGSVWPLGFLMRSSSMLRNRC